MFVGVWTDGEVVCELVKRHVVRGVLCLKYRYLMCFRVMCIRKGYCKY